jgi:hypothetical protein
MIKAEREEARVAKYMKRGNLRFSATARVQLNFSTKVYIINGEDMPYFYR